MPPALRPATLAFVLAASSLLLALPVAQAQGLSLAINAGVSTRDHPQTVADTYRPLTEQAVRYIRGELRAVPLASSRVRDAIRDRAHPFMVIHTHHAVVAVQSGAYQVLAVSSDETDDQAYLMVGQNAPIKNLRDLSKVKISLGGKDSFATAMVRGAFLEQGMKLDDLDVMYTQYQDGVPFYIRNGFVAAGGTRLKQDATAWSGGGDRVLYEGPRLPVYAVVGATNIDPSIRAGIQRTFVELRDAAAGRPVLARLKMNGFVRPTAPEITRVATWLGYGAVAPEAVLATP